MSTNALQLIIAAIFSPKTQAADASNGKRRIPSLFFLSQSAIFCISIPSTIAHAHLSGQRIKSRPGNIVLVHA
jgi:hypothetical protein